MAPVRWLAPLALSAVPALSAQSALYRSFNLNGTWTPPPGVVQFNFIHRFFVADASGFHKVSNYPTFTFGVGIVPGVMLGTQYSTNSRVGLPQQNEFELFARWRPLGEEGRDGFALSLSPAFNTAAHSADGELAAGYTRGAVTLSGTARFLSKPFGTSKSDVALGAGVVFRLNPYVALAGDYAKLLDRDTAAAWSAGISLLIPGSPHTFSLHASKALANTMQSSSAAFPEVLYGFEFTIPLHLERFAPWFGGGRPAGPPAPVGAEAAVEVEIRAYRFQRDTVYVAAGQSIRWINADPVEHTVTFDAGGPPGSPVLASRQGFVARFDRPGTYPYRCIPHPYMTGVVVVR
ncbi:MAG TPA: plastocyanin/azurin family copper-binding protein [Gemmatimonadales bacterium]|nr:plastocyanin/azurin family copper-binding protein [Gemmatimonadales bacterium]